MPSLLDTEFCARSLCSLEKLCIWLGESRIVILLPVYLKQFICPNNHSASDAGRAALAVLDHLNRMMDHSTCEFLHLMDSWILSRPCLKPGV